MTQGLSTDDLAGRPIGQPDASEPDRRDADPVADAGGAHDVDPAPASSTEMPLLDDHEADDFLARWSEVQARFVDDPQGAVRDGDGLVADLMQGLASRFSERKAVLEEQWNKGGEPETEELRLALQQYRSFFQRLLAT